MNFQSKNNKNVSFDNAIKYLDSLVSYEKMRNIPYNEEFFHLEKVKIFLEKWGVDYSKISFVHVAGSKGKGTVSSMIANYLWEKREKVGLYTSPHIISITERIKINGFSISENLFALYVQDIKNLMKKYEELKLTYFEVLFVMALKFFVDENVKYAVMETGLGGRLDATNIIFPKVCALTSIEKEHTDILGENIEDIIFEKLGIMKEGVPFVVGRQKEDVLNILKKKLKGNKDVYFVENQEIIGDFKKINAELVKMVLKSLLGGVDENIFEFVLRNFKMIGRFDLWNIEGKNVVFDIAHTPESMKVLTSSLCEKFPDKKFVFLISVLKDKNLQEIINILSVLSLKIIFTLSNKERGVTEVGFGKVKTFFKGDFVFKSDYLMAFVELLQNLGKDEVLVVTGSSYLVGEILRELE